MVISGLACQCIYYYVCTKSVAVDSGIAKGGARLGLAYQIVSVIHLT